jgi:hypothetical protein
VPCIQGDMNDHIGSLLKDHSDNTSPGVQDLLDGALLNQPGRAAEYATQKSHVLPVVPKTIPDKQEIPARRIQTISLPVMPSTTTSLSVQKSKTPFRVPNDHLSVPDGPSRGIQIRPTRCAVPGSSRTFSVMDLLRRLSEPVTVAGQPVAQPSMDPMHHQVHDASSINTIPSETVHEYTLKSRGRDYAIITVASHAPNTQDIPLLYFGEELNGFVSLSLDDLNDMMKVDVVVS